MAGSVAVPGMLPSSTSQWTHGLARPVAPVPVRSRAPRFAQGVERTAAVGQLWSRSQLLAVRVGEKGFVERVRRGVA